MLNATQKQSWDAGIQIPDDETIADNDDLDRTGKSGSKIPLGTMFMRRRPSRNPSRTGMSGSSRLLGKKKENHATLEIDTTTVKEETAENNDHLKEQNVVRPQEERPRRN